MSHKTVLFLEERQVLRKRDAQGIGYIQAGKRPLCIACLERVLRCKQRVTRAARSKDFANIVQVLAPGICSLELELFKQVVGAELHLQSMVVGEPAVVARPNHTCTAVHTTHIRGDKSWRS